VTLPADGGGPLILDAASSGSERLLELLLTKGADRNYVNRRGETLLHRASQGGLKPVVEAEIARGVDVDVRMFNGETPLSAAVSAGHKEIAEILIARGADVKAEDNYCSTLLHCAAESGNPELIGYLLEKGLKVNARNHWGGIAIASLVQRSGSKEAFDLLLSKGADPNLRDNTGESAFTWAAITGKTEIVKACWENLSAERRREFGPQALNRAAGQGRNEIVEYLEAEGVDIDSRLWNGRTALLAASSGGRAETVKLLLARGARLDAADELGRTPLQEAAVIGSVDIMKTLLAAGADVNALDNDGNSALFLARAYGRKAAAEFLEGKGGLAKDAEPNLLSAELKRGEALIWFLGHSSWAIKTSEHFLIFDYVGRGGRGADAPALSNGNIIPEEIADKDVLVFTSHAHGDHYNPLIYGWKSKLPKSRFFFGWDLDTPFEAHKFGEPRSKLELADVKVYTIYDHHETVPEVAYLIKIDGLDLFFSGDYLGRYEEDFPYLKTLTEGVDVAFCGCGGKIHADAANELGAKYLLPMHAWPFMYEGFAHFRSGVKNARIMPAIYPGDRFLYKNRSMTQFFAKVKPSGNE
jgi:ankyrin repeat protein/L-ascorbate metabolism protein UlaG (beta-lactamase superfamily)